MCAFSSPPTLLAFHLSHSLPALKSKHLTCHVLQDSLGQCNWHLVLSSFLKLLSIWFKHLLSVLFLTQRSARDSDRVVLRQTRYKRRAIWQNLYKCKLYILFDLRVHLGIYPTGNLSLIHLFRNGWIWQARCRNFFMISKTENNLNIYQKGIHVYTIGSSKAAFLNQGWFCMQGKFVNFWRYYAFHYWGGAAVI